MEEAELPECPVCLQPYDAASAIPRVLSCGHTTCESCLKQLPNPFPNTLRCTVCTLLVKYSNCPSSLPKNLDLLHISSVLQNHSTEGKDVVSSSFPPIREKIENQSLVLPLIPKYWSYEFYCKWRKWVLPEDCIQIYKVDLKDGCGMLCGQVLNSFESFLVTGGVVRENETVRLVKVGLFMEDENASKFFKHSYESRIVTVLHGMRENERNELGFILNTNFSFSNVGKVYGFWYDENVRNVYIVFEKLDSPNLLENLLKKEGDKEERLSIGEMSGFGMLSMEMCEIVSRFHLEGMVIGSLGGSCFGFNNFGRVYVDLSEVLNIGRRLNLVIRRGHKDLEIDLKRTLLDENLVFIAPEMLLQFLARGGFELDCGKTRYEVSHASDVWSLTCLLVWLIVGNSFSEEMKTYLHRLVNAITDEKECDYSCLYTIWLEKIVALLGGRLGFECVALQEILCRCLDFDPGNRPVVTELWKCLRELVIKPQCDTGLSLKPEIKKEKFGHCVVLGELCQIVEGTNKELVDIQGDKERANVDQDGGMNGDVGDGASRVHVKCIEMKGHLDCITGLAIGGGFLFSSSYDKMVCVWSLQDFKHVHSFKGHEHRVMAVVFVDGEQPLCVSGDNEGVICIWEASFPFDEIPIKKLYEKKDWRYSGIHALAISGTGYLYTGSGDKLIKAWSLKDYTLSCAISGHKSVVSSLVVCNGVLYSGSWDGTVRLWSLSDHSPLTVLGEDKLGNVTSVTSLSAEHHLLFVGHENGCIKIWDNNILVKSSQTHNGSVFSVSKKGKWLFAGGWDKKISVQEISENGNGMEAIHVGSIACDSVIIALMYWEGKLFVGQADRTIKVYYGVFEDRIQH